MTITGKYVHANGIDIYYEEHGQPDGQALVLIHGGGLTGASWEPYLPAFVEHYRVITPDTRGHGRTSGRTADTGEILTFGLLAADVAAFIRELGLEKPFVAGYSDGGQIVLEFGIRYSDLAGALVVGGAYPELTELSVQWAAGLLGDAGSPEIDAEKIERENAEFVGLIKEQQGADNWQNYLKQMKPLWNQRLNYTQADFARVSVPTLVIRADRDELNPMEEAVRLYQALPKAELAVISGADHGELVFSPEKIALARPLIADFLKRHCPEV